MPDRNDRMVLEAMVGLLDATGRFNFIVWGDIDRTIPAVGATAHILKYQVDYDGRLSNSDEDTRVIRYRVTLRYNNQSEATRRDKIENLEYMITNLFHNKSIKGLTASDHTHITRIRDEDKAPTGQSIKYIEGTFGYTHPRRDGLTVD
jgi:hypothetical protein